MTTRPTSDTVAALCGHTVLDVDGNEEPCGRQADFWRWYQDVEHEDCLEPACDWHANEGGRRISEQYDKIDRYQRLDLIHMRDQLRMSHAMGEALGVDQNDADACVPGCNEGAGGLEHDLHHLIERDAARGAAIERVRELHKPCPDCLAGDCHRCNKSWPCPTIRALDAADEAHQQQIGGETA